MTGHTRPPEVGAKISAAKKGVREIQLAPTEITLTDAWREFGIGRCVLRDGAENGRLRHRRVERPGKQPDALVFDRDELREDLARWPCSYPGCEAPAPGRSGRCGEHAARGEPARELTCAHCGQRFTRPVSWLTEREGRGRYCSNECKGQAFDASRPGYLALLNPDGANEHHASVAAAIAADGLLGTATVAKAKRYSVATIVAAAGAGALPSELRTIDGSRRRVYQPADVAGWVPPWADQTTRRANVAGSVHGIAAKRRVHGRAAVETAAKHGVKVGRHSSVSEVQRDDVYRRADGIGPNPKRRSVRAISEDTGIGREMVRRLLAARSDTQPLN